jgi:four helix bundle protein
MSREHKKLRVFHMSDELAITTYKVTKKFPREELFGLTSQIRRAAISVPANIVEGCARRSAKDFIHFLYISLGSLSELGYYLEFALKLGYLSENDSKILNQGYLNTAKSLNALISSISGPKSETHKA